MRVTGVILSGGKSSRMGKNKSLLPLIGQPAISYIVDELNQICDEVLIITNEPSLYDFLDIPKYKDIWKDKGPLGGLHAALHYGNGDIFIVAACDMPFINNNVYKYLLKVIENHDAIVPKYEGRLQPLAAIYNKSVLPSVEQLIKTDRLKIRCLLNEIDTYILEKFPYILHSQLPKHFFNMNSPDEYEDAKRYKH